MLTDGVKSYGLGTRNLQRYDTALKDVQEMIKRLTEEIAADEAVLNGTGARKAVAVVPSDW